jgi:D-glycerate 3-kinase
VSIIQNTLQGPPHNLPTIVLSADDLYLTHEDQVKLAQANPDNPLLQHRGQPSTHDLPLGVEVFSSLRAYRPTKIPEYNKAAFNGHGDRVPSSEWQEVNQGDKKIKVLLYEGWCVGFRPLDDDTLLQTWENAVKQKEAGQYIGRLGYNKLEDVKAINEALRSYNNITE